jgi:hypothetical protein
MAAAGVTAQAIVDALDGALPPDLPGAFRLIEGPTVDLSGGWTSPWYLQPPTSARLLKSPHLPFAAESRKGGDHTCWSDAPWLKGVFLEPTLQPGTPAWQAPLTLMQLAPALMAELGRPAHAAPSREAHAWH